MSVRNVPVSSIIGRIRQRADMMSDQFRTDANILALVNEEWCELYNEIIMARGHDFYLTTYSFTTVGGTDTYSIGSVSGGVFELRGIDIVFNNVVITARPFENAERNQYSAVDSYGWTETTTVWYRMEAENIRFMPKPMGAHTVVVRFVQAPVNLTSSSSIDGIAGWEQFVVCGAAAKLRDSEETECQLLLAEKERWRDIIRRMVPHRDASAPVRIADTRPKVAWSWRRW